MGKRKTVTDIQEHALLNVIIEAIQEKKGHKIVKLDLQDIKNTVCDFFVICEAESTTQVSAIADNVEKQAMLTLKNPPHHIEGRENCHWILLDFFDIVVHVFLREHRDFYKLEELWSDAKIELIQE